MKKASLKDTAKQKMVDKDSFIYGTKPSKPNEGIEVKPKRGKAVKKDSGIEVEPKGVKKVSCYMPLTLWIKYKSYELEQIKQGKSVSLNRIMLDLLEKKLEKN